MSNSSKETAMTSTLTFDTAPLARAIEARDAAAQLEYYASDAVLTVVDHLNPPSRPRVVRGSAALRTHLFDVCARDMVHRVEAAIATADRIAFEVACSYPDGTRVQCLCLAGVVDGRIAWQHQVQAWDD
jgi:ketosteroid isomerase-like protein